MHDSGGGGGYAGTNWFAHDTASMWRMVENQDTDNHWRHVSGLRKITELTSTHLWRLKEYREKLAAAWPPERSPAAAAFVGRLDYLIAHVQQTHDVAAANYTTVMTATSTLQLARGQVSAIHEDWVNKRRQKQDYDDAVAFQMDSQLPGVNLGDPPVSDEEMERLNNKARAVMYDLSSTLLQSQAQLQRPAPYQPAGSRSPDNPEVYGGAPAPVIPPVLPLPAPAAAPAPVPAANVATQAPTAPVFGPVLGGAGPVTTVPPPTTGVITPAPAPITAPGVFPTSPGIVPGGPIAAPTTTPNTVRPGAVPNVASPPRTMPLGGVIGAPPGAGLGQPALSPASRVNPVGGVIGGTAGGRPTGSASMVPPGTGRPAAAPPGVTQARRGDGTPLAPGAQGQRRSRREEANKRWDPDNPWEIASGVAPVVRPDQDNRRIDPGPAIGLHP